MLRIVTNKNNIATNFNNHSHSQIGKLLIP